MKRQRKPAKLDARRRADVDVSQNRSAESGAPRPVRFGLIVVAVVVLGVAAGVYVGSRSWQRRVIEQTSDSEIIKTVTIGHEPWLTDPAFSPEATIEQLKKCGTENVSKCLRAFPDSAAAAGIAGRWWLNVGPIDKARQMLQRCIQLDPRFADGYFGLGVIAKDGGDFDEAAKMFREVLEVNPSDVATPALLGEVLMKSGRIPEAVTFLEQVARQPNPPVTAVSCLGQAYLQSKQYDKARATYEAIIAAIPEDGSAYYGLARAYARLGERAKSRECLKKYRSIVTVDQNKLVRSVREYSDPNSLRQYLVETTVGCATVYLKHGQGDSAEKFWRMASIWDPANTQCRQQLLAWYDSQHRLADAVLIGRQLCKLQPDNPDCWLDVAILSGRLDQMEQAIAAAERAVQLAPENPKYKQAYEVIRQSR